MIEWIRRKYWRKQAGCHFGKSDFMIDHYRVHAIHMIPDEIKEDQELDFYLLRLTNSNENVIAICPADKKCPIYLICKVSYTSQAILEVLTRIVRKLKNFGLPKLVNPNGEIIIRL